MTPIELAGWTILVLGAGMLAFMLYEQFAIGRQRRVVFQKQVAVLDSKLAGLREKREKQKAGTAAWNGFRKFRVDRKVIETKEICSFYLAPHDRKTPLPEFKPGQYLTFKLRIGRKSQIRCYSLSDSYDPDHYRVSIKKLPPPKSHPDAPPGLVSAHFHDVIEENDIVDVSAPAGNFVIDPHDSWGLVLCGSGVGVTPVLSMFKTLVNAASRREVWLFYGVTNGEADFLQEEIGRWRAVDMPNLHIVVCYSRPGKEDVEGRNYDRETRITTELLREVLPSNNFDFFNCGPAPMMSSLKEGLQKWGVPLDRTHDEAFYPPSSEEFDVGKLCVEFRKAQKKAELSGNITNLLKFAEDEGVEIPYGCRNGGCGTCQTAVISGEVQYGSPPEFDIAEGCCLPCVAIPKSDVVLDC